MEGFDLFLGWMDLSFCLNLLGIYSRQGRVILKTVLPLNFYFIFFYQQKGQEENKTVFLSRNREDKVCPNLPNALFRENESVFVLLYSFIPGPNPPLSPWFSRMFKYGRCLTF